MRGETRRKARRRIRRRSIAARIATKTTGAAAHGAGERTRPRAPRRTRPEVPSAALFWAEAGRNPFRRGGLHRTRPRRRICIRRVGRRTGKAPASKGEHGCPKQSRTLEGKSALAIHSASIAYVQGGGRRKYDIISTIPLVPWCSGCTRVFDTQSSGSTPDGTTSVSLTNR